MIQKIILVVDINPNFTYNSVMEKSLLKNYLKFAFRWQKGRQEGGYDKMLLLYSLFPIPFDIYIIRYPLNSFISPHIDKVEKGQHYRINFVIKKAISGGEFICKNPIYSSSRIKFFRPDISEHSVEKITKGHRYVLSIGWIKHNQ